MPTCTSHPCFFCYVGFGWQSVAPELLLIPRANVLSSSVNIGPGYKNQPRCINRKITDFLSSQCGASYVKSAIAPNNYNDAARAIYMGPHLLGHEALAMMVRFTLVNHIQEAS